MRHGQRYVGTVVIAVVEDLKVVGSCFDGVTVALNLVL